jgi:hypothetical protein
MVTLLLSAMKVKKTGQTSWRPPLSIREDIGAIFSKAQADVLFVLLSGINRIAIVPSKPLSKQMNRPQADVLPDTSNGKKPVLQKIRDLHRLWRLITGAFWPTLPDGREADEKSAECRLHVQAGASVVSLPATSSERVKWDRKVLCRKAGIQGAPGSSSIGLAFS